MISPFAFTSLSASLSSVSVVSPNDNPHAWTLAKMHFSCAEQQWHFFGVFWVSVGAILFWDANAGGPQARGPSAFGLECRSHQPFHCTSSETSSQGKRFRYTILQPFTPLQRSSASPIDTQSARCSHHICWSHPDPTDSCT